MLMAFFSSFKCVICFLILNIYFLPNFVFTTFNS